MNSGNTPLATKLIVSLLTLNLILLALLTVRSFQEKSAPVPAPVPTTTAVESPSAEEAVAPVVLATPPAIQSVPGRKPVTNVVSGTHAGFGSRGSPLPPMVGIAAPVVVAAPVPVPVRVARAAVQPPEVLVASGGGLAIVGWVTLAGEPPAEIAITMDAACAQTRTTPATTRHYIVSAEGGLANVFVYLKEGITQRHRPPAAPVLLDQVGCEFHPYVVALQTGQRLQIRNSDPVMHNVNATARVNRAFNFAQVARGQVNERVFPLAENFIRFKCDVHPWMFAYVNVVEHPFFAVTDTNGFFALPPGMPAGKYTLAAVHLKAGELTREITVGAGEEKPVEFTFSVPPLASK